VGAERGGAELRLGPPKQRAFLALLLTHLNQTVSRDQLVDGLWPETPPPTAVKTLQVFASGLRKALAEEAGLLVTRGQGYSFDLDPERLDAARFERLLAEGQAALSAGWPSAARSSLTAALALWRGPALADIPSEGFAAREAARLGQLRRAAVETRIEAELALGDHAQVIPELEALTAEHPLHEHLYGLLMLALYRAGRQAAALETYQSARSLLVEQLGVEPGPELQHLHRAILGHDDALHVPEQRREIPARSGEEDGHALAVPPALAVQPTRLVGRTSELDALSRMLAEDPVRLVTLTGAGGSGKTRLAVALADRLAPTFEGGVWFVDLAPVRDRAGVREAIEKAIEPRGPLEAFVAPLRALLVLDNFEQVLEGAPEAAQLLAAAPGLKIVATSRARLRLAAEREFPVDPLPESEAVELFVERARSISRDFAAGDGHVAAICRKLDGLPLALELAAARVKVLSPEALLARLDRRLPLLTGGARDLPERQQTLRGLIEWSYDLLSEEEQRVFRGLGVFVGGFTLEAAEQICEAEIDTLAVLVDNSLVRMIGGRFQLLQTIREYAIDRLDAAQEAGLRERHARWFNGYTAELDALTNGPEQQQALDRLAAEDGNARAAIEWALAAPDPDVALELSANMGWSWFMRGHYRDAKRFLAAALELDGGSDVVRAKALMRLGASLDELGEDDEAIAAYTQCAELRRTLGDLPGTAGALANIGGVYSKGDRASIERARPVLRESIEISRRLGDEIGVAGSTCNLGIVDLKLGAPERARPLFEESLAIATEHDHDWGKAVSHVNLGAALLELGETGAAERHFVDGLRAFHQLGNDGESLEAIEAVAAAAARDDPARAARLFGFSEALRTASGFPAPGEYDAKRVESAKSLVRELLGADRYRRLAGEGSTLSLEEVCSELLTQATVETGAASSARGESSR
jgi:predicted ATPase/DNA-binding SARP family transcriptional activator